jgi:DNA-directed RNA polymerase sigma subunit (sigma70/sigma32)
LASGRTSARHRRSKLRDPLFKALPERELRILKLRYGLDGNGAKTLEEVGTIEGMTRARVREIEEHAFERLRALGFEFGDPLVELHPTMFAVPP